MITNSKLNNVPTLVSTLEHSSLVVLVLGITSNFHTSLVLVLDPFAKLVLGPFYKNFHTKPGVVVWVFGFEGDSCLL
jgi:hypothetical protein